MTTDLETRFTHHPPKNETVIAMYAEIREEGFRLASLVDMHVPDGREKALALTKIEEAVMWANAGIARANK